jgi:hypothetical protein
MSGAKGILMGGGGGGAGGVGKRCITVTSCLFSQTEDGPAIIVCMSVCLSVCLSNTTPNQSLLVGTTQDDVQLLAHQILAKVSRSRSA